MPERYEREIDDILRNLERSRPKSPLRERLHLRRGPTRRPEQLHPGSSRSARHLLFKTSEWCLLAGILLRLVAAGIAFTSGSVNPLDLCAGHPRVPTGS